MFGEDELDRDRTGRVRVVDDHARVDEADEQDEEADPDPDRPLQAQRHGIHDGFPQPHEDEQQDDESLEHDDAHGTGRGQTLAEHQPECDGAVDPQAGGEGDRVVGDEAHEDAEEPCDQGRAAQGTGGRFIAGERSRG